MKKLAGIILALTLVFNLETIGVFAAPNNQRSGGVGRDASGAVCQFVDENKDGICDNYSNEGTHPKEGTGKRGGQGKSGGTRFADSNGDSICDNYGGGTCGRR